MSAVASAAVVAALGIGAVAVAAAGAVSAERQRVIGAADAAALAAADGASGLVAGAPCELAARVADANGARLLGCGLDGLDATVLVAGVVAGMPVRARSTAGQAP